MNQPTFIQRDRRNFLRLLSVTAGCVTLSGCAAMRKIDQGIYSAHQSVTHEDLITGERAVGFADRQQQIKQGNATMEKIVGEYPHLNEQVDRRMYSRLNRIFNRVHTVSHYAHENWEVLLLPDDNFNAFVTGGTYVAVYKGLMDTVQDDAAVAAILGHEIGHVSANHAFEKQSLLINLIEGDKVGSGFDFAYSALQEEEADEIGVVYTALAGYDPGAISTLWGAFAENDEWSWFRTHPASSDRARATHILGEKAKQYYVRGRINPDHLKLSRCNKFWCNK
ncbi:MAG: M48 family metallopeptidase [Gammaproteobacteria bacterium]|nr:M48 family metallopeptidase [Gammaproteobacteria bacterium]